MSVNSFNGVYIGKVIENEDDKKLGRIKVTVPYIYGSIPVEDLPWAEPCFPYGSHDTGIFFVPEKNALVSVMFIKGNIYKPIWLGVIFREKSNIVPQEVKDSYPNKKIIKTKSGYILFDDENEHIEIKHKNGSVVTFTSDGDIILQSKRDFIALSGRHIHLNSTSPNIIPIPEFKSEEEKEAMSEEELEQYNKQIEDYEIATTSNCGDQGSSTYVGGLGEECKSVAASPMRQWGVNQRNASKSYKNSQVKTIRSLSKHKKGSGDLRFASDFASRIENSLDELQKTYPELYSKFNFTSGFRTSSDAGASDSMHKYGLAFDFNFSSFECVEREKVYYIFGKNGIACTLDSWNGQDEGMHMEPANNMYTGSVPAPILTEEIPEEPEVPIATSYSYRATSLQSEFDI